MEITTTKLISFIVSVTLTLLLNGGIIGAGTTFLVKAYDFIEAPKQVWVWCLVFVVYTTISVLGSIAGATNKLFFGSEKDSVDRGFSAGVCGVGTCGVLALFIWGIMITGEIWGMDPNPYCVDNDGCNLWIFFQVMFWFLAALFSFALCVLCGGAVCWCKCIK